MRKNLFELELKTLNLLLITIHLDMITPGYDFKLGETALNELKLAIGWTEKFELVDIRKDDFFLCQALIPFLISLRKE